VIAPNGQTVHEGVDRDDARGSQFDDRSCVIRAEITGGPKSFAPRDARRSVGARQTIAASSAACNRSRNRTRYGAPLIQLKDIALTLRHAAVVRRGTVVSQSERVCLIGRNGSANRRC